MEAGDLVIVVESLPDWHWLTYTTGHVGIFMKVRGTTIGASDPVCEIFFFHSEEVHPVPTSFLRSLSAIHASR